MLIVSGSFSALILSHNRFIYLLGVESGAPKKHKEAVLTSTHETDVS